LRPKRDLTRASTRVLTSRITQKHTIIHTGENAMKQTMKAMILGLGLLAGGLAQVPLVQAQDRMPTISPDKYDETQKKFEI